MQRIKRLIRKRVVKEQRRNNCSFTWWWSKPGARYSKHRNVR